MSRLTKILLVVMVMGLIVGGIGVPDAIKLWKGDIDEIDSIEVGSLKAGEMYEGEIYDTYDIIAEETSTQSYGFIPVNKTVTPYYLVELENCYVIVDVTVKDDQSKFEKLLDETWDYLDGKTDDKPTPVKISTTAQKMPDKVKEFLKEYCEESGMSEEEYAKYVEDSYCLKTIVYKNTKFIPIVGFGIALLCAVILIIKKVTSPKIVNL